MRQKVFLNEISLSQTLPFKKRQEITDLKKKDRDLDHAHEIGRDHTRVGGSTDSLSSYV